MTKFLTDEWVKAVWDTVTGNEEVMNATRDADLLVVQVTTNVPDRGDLKYWFEFQDGEFRNGLGEPPRPPDATMQSAYNNSVGLYSGTLSMQSAMLSGRLKISGNLGKLMGQRRALEPLVPLIGHVTSEW